MDSKKCSDFADYIFDSFRASLGFEHKEELNLKDFERPESLENLKTSRKEAGRDRKTPTNKFASPGGKVVFVTCKSSSSGKVWEEVIHRANDYYQKLKPEGKKMGTFDDLIIVVAPGFAKEAIECAKNLDVLCIEARDMLRLIGFLYNLPEEEKGIALKHIKKLFNPQNYSTAVDDFMKFLSQMFREKNSEA